MAAVVAQYWDQAHQIQMQVLFNLKLSSQVVKGGLAVLDSVLRILVFLLIAYLEMSRPADMGKWFCFQVPLKTSCIWNG